MANFCSSCGSAVNGRFCTACGAAVTSSAPQGAAPADGPPPQTWTAPPRATGSSSAAKILLIVFAVLVLLGGVGVAGVVYVGYRAKQKLAEYGFSGETATLRSFPVSKGTGCRMLEGQEAAGILGVVVERAESSAREPDDSEVCKYWVSAAERRRLLSAEIASGVKEVGKGDEKTGTEGFEKVIGGALGAVIEAAGDNKEADCAFSLEVWHSRGRAMWDKMESAKTNVKDVVGVDYAGMAAQQLDGIGDRAMVLPGGHSIMVLKGDKFFLLGFQQFVPGREKTAALAKVVAGRV